MQNSPLENRKGLNYITINVFMSKKVLRNQNIAAYIYLKINFGSFAMP